VAERIPDQYTYSDMATGDFDRDMKDEVLATMKKDDGFSPIDLDPKQWGNWTMGYNATLFLNNAWTNSFVFIRAAGDVDGDGFDDIVTLSDYGTGGKILMAWKTKPYGENRWTYDTNLCTVFLNTEEDSVDGTTAFSDSETIASIDCGDYQGDGDDEIVLITKEGRFVWVDLEVGANMYQVLKTSSYFPPEILSLMSLTKMTELMKFKVRVGDLDGNKDAETVVLYMMPFSGVSMMRVYDWNNTLLGTSKPNNVWNNWNRTFASYVSDVAIGDMDADGCEDLAVGQYSNLAGAKVKVYKGANVTSASTSKDIIIISASTAPKIPCLALGDFDGKGGVMAQFVEEMPPKPPKVHPIAVINAPPYEEGLNTGSATYTTSSEQSYESSKGFTVSAGISVAVGGGVDIPFVGEVSAKIGVSVEREWSRTRSSGYSLAESRSYTANNKDVVIGMKTDYVTYKYKLLGPANATVRFDQCANSTVYISVPVNIVTEALTIDEAMEDPLFASAYRFNHTVGDVSSYPTSLSQIVTPYTDTLLGANNPIKVDSLLERSWEVSETEWSGTSFEESISVTVTAGVETPYTQTDISGGLGQTKSHTFSNSFTQALGGTTTEIPLAADPLFGYKYTPHVMRVLKSGGGFLPDLCYYQLVYVVNQMNDGHRYGISMDSTNGTVHNVDPLAPCEFAFNVTNHGSMTQDISLSYSNSGIGNQENVVFSQNPLMKMGPGETRMVYLSMNSVMKAATGDDVFTVDAKSSGNASCTVSQQVTMHTNAIFEFSLTANQTEANVHCGESLIMDIYIYNDGSAADDYMLYLLGVPSGWTMTLNPSSVSSLGAWRSAIIELNIMATGAAPGDRAVFMLQAVSKTSLRSTFLTLQANAFVHYGANLSFAQEAQYTMRGRTVAYDLTVTNTGEWLDTFDLAVSPPKGWGITLDQYAVTLAAGASMTIGMTAIVPNDAMFETYSIGINALSRADISATSGSETRAVVSDMAVMEEWVRAGWDNASASGDLDKDAAGTLEIVSATGNAIKVTHAETHAETIFASAMRVNDIVIAQLDGDANNEILVSHDRGFAVYDGIPPYTQQDLNLNLLLIDPNPSYLPTNVSALSAADLNGDGICEILLGTYQDYPHAGLPARMIVQSIYILKYNSTTNKYDDLSQTSVGAKDLYLEEPKYLSTIYEWTITSIAPTVFKKNSYTYLAIGTTEMYYAGNSIDPATLYTDYWRVTGRVAGIRTFWDTPTKKWYCSLDLSGVSEGCSWQVPFDDPVTGLKTGDVDDDGVGELVAIAGRGAHAIEFNWHNKPATPLWYYDLETKFSSFPGEVLNSFASTSNIRFQSLATPGIRWYATHFAPWEPQQLEKLAVGDIDGDGVCEAMALSRDGILYGVWFSPVERTWSSYPFDNCGGIGIGDMDLDGDPEVSVTDGSALTILRIAPRYKSQVIITPDELDVIPGHSVSFQVTVANLGQELDSFDMRIDYIPVDWTVTLNQYSVSLYPKETMNVTLSVLTPSYVGQHQTKVLHISAISQGDPHVLSSDVCSVYVKDIVPPPRVEFVGVRDLNNGKGVVVTWSVSEDNAGLKCYHVYRDGVLWLDTNVPKAIDTSAGTHSYYVIPEDFGGNKPAASDTYALWGTDNLPPVISLAAKMINSNTARVTIASDETLSGGVPTGAYLAPNGDTGALSFASTGTNIWTADVSIAYGGDYTFTVTATDLTGHATTQRVGLFNDVQAPTLNMTVETYLGTNGIALTTNAKLWVNVTASETLQTAPSIRVLHRDAAGGVLFDTTNSMGQTGNDSYAYLLQNYSSFSGAYAITISGSDLDGNANTAKAYGIFDRFETGFSPYWHNYTGNGFATLNLRYQSAPPMYGGAEVYFLMTETSDHAAPQYLLPTKTPYVKYHFTTYDVGMGGIANITQCNVRITPGFNNYDWTYFGNYNTLSWTGSSWGASAFQREGYEWWDSMINPMNPVYYYVVNASYRNMGAWSQGLSDELVFIQADPINPQKPVLRAPISGSSVISPVTFRWNPVTKGDLLLEEPMVAGIYYYPDDPAVHYLVQVDDNVGFAHPTQYQSDGSAISLTKSFAVGTYFWRATAVNPSGRTNWSSPGVPFSVIAPANAPPVAWAIGWQNWSVGAEVPLVGYYTDSDARFFDWDFNGDGTYEYTTNQSASVGHVYDISGIYHVSFRVRDSIGQSATTSTYVFIGSIGDRDSDGDGISNNQDAFPNDPAEWNDTDGDGIGDNADPDDDNDGYSDAVEIIAGTDPLDQNSVPSDIDNDGLADVVDPDIDGDGYENANDTFPDDQTEWQDTDTDGIGDNSDSDIDGDGYLNPQDAFPYNDTEWNDTDRDGIGDNSDDDIDGDGYKNWNDDFPYDETQWRDTDRDGLGDNQTGTNPDPDIDGDGFLNPQDLFPYDDSEWSDMDGDGIGDNSDDDIDGDGYDNWEDAFPYDAAEWNDTDRDGIGDNSDSDIDGDDYLNANDAFPGNPNEWNDTDGDGIGDNTDLDIDGDGVDNWEDAYPFDPTRSARAEAGDLNAISWAPILALGLGILALVIALIALLRPKEPTPEPEDDGPEPTAPETAPKI
jgi:uncharacterized membrane protein